MVGSEHAWRFEAIGVPWEVVTSAPLGDEVRARVEAVIERFDRDWSRFRNDSVVAGLAAAGGTSVMPADGVEMLALYAELSDATDGAVTPLIGDSLNALGYDSRLSLQPGVAVPAVPWRSSLRWDERSLTLAAPATIDVGAVGKGRLVDLVLAIVSSAVHGDVIVDGSGDLAVRGAPVLVGLEHPFDPQRAIGVFEVTDRALCASAINRRVWGDGLHHVLDGRTGMPVKTVAATWAVAADAMTADAASTALFFDGGPRFAFEHEVEWVRMLTDGRVEYSPGCTAEVYT